MLKEFKEFAMRGNVVDMAIGIVIGGAFGAIVTAIVEKLIMPLVGIATGGVDFSKYAYKVAGNEFGVGAVLTALINFIIIAFVLFLIVKGMNKLKRPEPVAEEEVTTKACPFCKTDIALDATRCPNCTSQLEV